MKSKICLGVYAIFSVACMLWLILGEKIGLKGSCISGSLLAIIAICMWIHLKEKKINISGWILECVFCFFVPIFFLIVVYQKPLNNPEFWMYTYLLIQATQMILLVVIGSVRWAIILNTCLYCLLLLANSFTMIFRGSPFRPSDILSLSTAWNVRGGYLKTIKVTGEMVCIFLLFFCVICGVSTMLKKQKKRNIKYAVLVRTFAAIALGICVFFLKLFDLNQYDYNGFRVDFHIDDYGYIAQFVMEWRGMKVEAPEGYNKETIANALMCEAGDENGNYPDIIVIMDEAFCDYSLVGELPLNKDYLPYIHSLPDTMKGKCYVSVLGGNTCNTEWEFLTGNSLAFCSNAIPFNQYIQKNKYSFAWYLKELGYDTAAIHPWYPTGWKRDVVYPMLGLDKFYSILDFDKTYANMSFDERRVDVQKDESIYVRDLISDIASFDKIISLYEEHVKGSDNPFFVFNVTMQNHGDYKYKDYESPIRLTEEMENQDRIEQYLGLASETDKAFEKLIAYFDKVNRDTIILFFGDHQPRMNEELYKRLEENNQGKSVLETKEDRYVVPYILWSNMDLGESEYKELSANYLSVMLADYAGLPMDNWQRFLKETYEKVPIINAFGIKTDEMKWLPFDKNQIKKHPELKEYEKLQYYRMFDEKR